MKILTSWLRELCDPGLSPQEIAHKLTAAGAEVEAVERLGRHLESVVVAEIRVRNPHPQADRLSVCEVFDGQRTLQVVCGAPNAAAGMRVPLAQVGAVLPDGRTIERATVRGVESEGMLCSAKELALSEDAAGLMDLGPDALLGQTLAAALGLDDVLLHLNLTPNRVDALSHLGVARELSVLTGAQLKVNVPALPSLSGEAPARVVVDAPERCGRYASYVIEGVKIGPSPQWLRRRLEACGVRSISNVVDATNYVLLELGHPLHAFDLDKLAEQTIEVAEAREQAAKQPLSSGHPEGVVMVYVRTARPGETMKTLDGKERALDPDDLVIADAVRAQALAGVMGGGDSEVGPGTTRLLLESAWFQPQSVRRTSRRHGLKC